ncbi:MAG: HD domain-containing protein [Treponema sp.]|nr:HD domain-containing protein [Treponema sp.]
MGETAWTALREGYTVPVRDILWGHIYLKPAMAALTETVAFMRLYRILQLGPAYRVYPGATHTRAAHSLGVYHLGRRLLLSLAEQGAEAWISPQGVRSFLCACLLHDLGHFPYTHSLKELPLRSHEDLTAELIRAEPLRSLLGAAGADPDLTAAIVETAPGRWSGAELAFYRRLLSGCMDPDKLDYLNRDARCCGVPYGVQDVDYIVSRLHPQPERGVDIDSRGIPSVESILFAKYLMYRTVYWHRDVRSATAMVKKAILGGLDAGVLAPEELYGLDDQGLFALLADCRGRTPGNRALFDLAARVREGPLHRSVAEIPYDPAWHGPLTGLRERARAEEALAEDLGRAAGCRIAPGELIIDLPEPVSFETNLFISDEGLPFPGETGVFKTDVVEGLVKQVRIIRILLDPILENKVQCAGKGGICIGKFTIPPKTWSLPR